LTDMQPPRSKMMMTKTVMKAIYSATDLQGFQSRQQLDTMI
jgi:hypothetical protein